MADTTEQFYDTISAQYADLIKRCVPRYDEMLSTLFAYLPKQYVPKSVLELGCGTGNLTCLLSQYFPSSAITAVDISKECLVQCQQRVSSDRVLFVQSDFTELDCPDRSFDLIISSIAIHHLKDEDKQQLFKKLSSWLCGEGIFAFCDQFRGETDYLYSQHIAAWKAYAFEQGTTEAEWQTWMSHQDEHDHHASLYNHMNWLKKARFGVVDCVWRHLLWATIHARRP